MRKPLLGFLLIWVALLCVSCGPSIPEGTTPSPPPASGKTATILGTVTDRIWETPLPGVLVKAETQSGGFFYTYSNASGQFELRVPLEQMTVTWSKEGYQPHYLSVSFSTAGQLLRYEVRLSPLS